MRFPARRFSLAFLCCASLAAPAPIYAQAATDWQARVDSLAEATLEATGLPSIQVAVGFQGAVVFAGAYGFADLEHEVPATPQTRYRTATISKWFTGTAVMQLHEKGQLALDAPIQTYCPHYPEKPWPSSMKPMTLG